MMRVATLAVVVGMVVMILTLAVIGGFKSQIYTKLSGLSGHIVVAGREGVVPSAESLIIYGDELRDIVSGVSPLRSSTYILRGAIVRGEDFMDGVVVKGVDSLFNAPFFEESLIDGCVPQFGTGRSRRELLLSIDLASQMGVGEGERVDILFTDERSGEVDRLTFKVGGIYSAGVGEMERRVIIADIETLRRVNGWTSDEVSGCEVWVEDVDKTAEIAENINKTITFGVSEELDDVRALSLEELYPALFDWLKTHDVNGVVVVTIMLIVALFNLITALLILVLERSRMIGILKSLGMENGALQRVFLYRALSITLRGLAWGNGVGLLLCWTQSQWGIVKLEASGYMLSEVPINLGVGWLVALNLGVVVVVMLVMTIPTRMVASVHPDEIVKYR